MTVYLVWRHTFNGSELQHVSSTVKKAKALVPDVKDWHEYLNMWEGTSPEAEFQIVPVEVE